MKYYKTYMDRQEISPAGHEKLLELEPRAARPAGRPWGKWVALAACCALAVGLGVWRLAAPGQPAGQLTSDSAVPGQKDTYGPGETPPGEQGDGIVVKGPDGAALDFFAIPYIAYPELEKGAAVDAQIALPEGYFEEALTLADLQTIFWGPEGKPEGAEGDLPWTLDWGGYALSGRAYYDGTGALLWLCVFGEHPDGPSFTLELRPEALPPSCLVEPGRTATDVRGTEVTGWSRTYDRDGDGVDDVICGSEFMAGDVGVRFETVVPADAAGDPAGACQLANTLLVRQALSDDGGLYLGHLMTAEEVPAWREAEFSSLEEARQEREFVPYLPAEDFTGYGEFSGRMTYQEGNEHTLNLRWSWGYDDVTIRVELPEGDTVWGCFVDYGAPETYDLRLYPVPRADSVPEEYRETVDNPVFRAEDMSREIVEARAYAPNEAGDTNSLRISFSVLHPGGTLVGYNCEGLTVDRVWALVSETLA